VRKCGKRNPDNESGVVRTAGFSNLLRVLQVRDTGQIGKSALREIPGRLENLPYIKGTQ